jgi:hypothetical protein
VGLASPGLFKWRRPFHIESFLFGYLKKLDPDHGRPLPNTCHSFTQTWAAHEAKVFRGDATPRRLARLSRPTYTAVNLLFADARLHGVFPSMAAPGVCLHLARASSQKMGRPSSTFA